MFVDVRNTRHKLQNKMKKVIATIRTLLGLTIFIVSILLGSDIFTKVDLNRYGIIAALICTIFLLYTSFYLLYSGITILFNKPNNKIIIKSGLFCYFLVLLSFVWFISVNDVDGHWALYVLLVGGLVWIGVEELRIKN